MSVFGATVFGSKRTTHQTIDCDKSGLMQQVARIFKTKKPPVTPEETLDIFAFMEAAEESIISGSKPVTLKEVMQSARNNATENFTRTMIRTLL